MHDFHRAGFMNHKEHSLSAGDTLTSSGFRPVGRMLAESQGGLFHIAQEQVSTGHLSSHIPMMRGSCKETYEVYKALWPHIKSPFLFAHGNLRMEMEGCGKARL
jgi:hypothetical protein